MQRSPQAVPGASSTASRSDGSRVGRAAAHARRRPGSAWRSRPGPAALPSRARAEPPAPGGQVRPLDAGTDDLVRPPVERLQDQLVGQRDRLEQRHQLVAAVVAGPAQEQAQVDLARRERAQLQEASLAASCAKLLRRQPLGPLVGGVAELDERRPRALAHARDRVRAQRQRPGERLAPVRERVVDDVPAARGRRPGRRVAGRRSTESTFGTGRNTVRATGRSTLTSQASWASTDGTP